MKFDAVVFDLDGVLLSTDNFHYLAWKKLADRENIYFDRTINHRLRGVSRMESLEIVLERSSRTYTAAKKQEMCEYKNNIYREMLGELTPADLFPQVRELLDELARLQVKTAIASSSKNTGFILERVGLMDYFAGHIADGLCIANSKPHPEVFLKAAEFINTPPQRCLAVEDAEAGIIAARAANMTTLGVGPAAELPLPDYKAKENMTATILSLLKY